jgi:hypothetical protein
MNRLTDTFRPTAAYSEEREPINIAPEVRERLRTLLYRPEFNGTGVGYSAFIDRACEVAEAELAVQRSAKERKAQHEAEERPPHTSRESRA